MLVEQHYSVGPTTAVTFINNGIVSFKQNFLYEKFQKIGMLYALTFPISFTNTQSDLCFC